MSTEKTALFRLLLPTFCCLTSGALLLSENWTLSDNNVSSSAPPVVKHKLRFGRGEMASFKRKRSENKFLYDDLENSLLIDSLQLRHDHVCEGQRLSLKCPAHTQIIVESAFFGRNVPYGKLCPPRQPSQNAEKLSSSSAPLLLWEERYEDIGCDVSNAHSKVKEVCQYHRRCKVNANSQFFGRDPCPMTSKYLQVDYKCKPSRFGSENFCEGSQMNLSCKANQRLALYSATYGRTVANSPAECSESAPALFDCTTDVLQKLTPLCHAQQKCSVQVDDAEFDFGPCGVGVKKYLNVVFICVSEAVFSDVALSGQWASEESSNELNGQKALPPLLTYSTTTSSTQNDASDTYLESHWRGRISNLSRSASSETADSVNNATSVACTTPRFPPAVSHTMAQLQNWLSTYRYIHGNQEKFFLYFGLSASTGVIALLAFCTVQLCWRHRHRSSGDFGSDASEKRTNSRFSSKADMAAVQPLTTFDEARVEMSDLGRDGISFLRFNHPTPPKSNAPTSLPFQFYS